MDKAYEHLKHEESTYKLWEDSGVFNPDNNKSSKKSVKNSSSFSIIMPPPNANDPLHVGHAMFISLEDILIRYHRMKGDDTVWIPGTDHAGIETQFLFEKKLAKKGESRFQFDRETLYKMIWDYVQENSGIAVDQMKKLGASADWSRYKFTLDPDIVKEVIGTFTNLHNDGLVYRDLKLVNFCTKCGTSYSELEVLHVERTDKLYYLKYGPFTLATTRPETKFADTAVAVHPEDPRYKKYIGTEIEVEGFNSPFKMKVVADEYVDREFGTGVVKITPYHDFNDYEVWQRHKDEMPKPQQVIGFDGRLTSVAGKYEGLKVKVARDQIEQEMKEKGLLEKVNEAYVHTVGTCYKCGTVLEPLPLPQFFIKVKDKKVNLTQKALDALDNGDTKIHGAGRDKILRHWLENLKDWNISRQIVWGIRIPVWYDVEKYPQIEVMFVDKEKKIQRGPVGELKKKYWHEIQTGLQQLRAPADAGFIVSASSPGDNFLQETDTFDTWFSSGQWPVVTLKTTQEGDFDRFYPTTVMETGYDILPFWVMRMMLLGIYATGKSPFKHVYLHGLVRDEKGQKMSKSKGNVLNPIDVSTKYGADAVRMSLVMSSTPGSDSSVGESKIRGMRNFSNKIWNAARFVMMMKEENKIQSTGEGNQAFRDHLNEVVTLITKQMDDLKIGLAAETVHNEFWHWFCDLSIEDAKQGKISLDELLTGLQTLLRLLHPFAPFVTEAVWQELKKNKLVEEDVLMAAAWPNA